MTYELTLSIREDSPQGQNIAALSETQQLTREEAALRILAMPKPNTKANAAARRILGAFNTPEDAALIDDALNIAMADRQRRNRER